MAWSGERYTPFFDLGVLDFARLADRLLDDKALHGSMFKVWGKCKSSCTKKCWLKCRLVEDGIVRAAASEGVLPNFPVGDYLRLGGSGSEKWFDPETAHDPDRAVAGGCGLAPARIRRSKHRFR